MSQNIVSQKVLSGIPVCTTKFSVFVIEKTVFRTENFSACADFFWTKPGLDGLRYDKICGG
jgi:hypothetical protein